MDKWIRVTDSSGNYAEGGYINLTQVNRIFIAPSAAGGFRFMIGYSGSTALVPGYATYPTAQAARDALTDFLNGAVAVPTPVDNVLE